VLDGPPPAVGEVDGVPADLAAIVDKSMARDRADRYPMAGALAEELKKFQTGQLVGAHRYSLGELVRRWARRHRTPLVVAGLAIVALVVAGIWSYTRIVGEKARADDARDNAIAAQRAAEARNEQLIVAQARGAIERDPTETIAWLAQLPESSPLWGEARVLAADARSRGVARVYDGHHGDVRALARSRDGALLATGGDDGTIRCGRSRPVLSAFFARASRSSRSRCRRMVGTSPRPQALPFAFTTSSPGPRASSPAARAHSRSPPTAEA